jgi:hypothetical protein
MSTNTAIQRFTSGLDYGVVPGAPASISREDIATWKARVSPDVAHYFVERYEELQREYQLLVDSYELNRLVYNSQINFEPILGQTYYLYEKSSTHRFLSLISPHHTFWSGFLCAVRLTTSYTWERVPLPDK